MTTRLTKSSAPNATRATTHKTLMNLTLTNMKTFNIAINYKAEIEAENEDDAVERFLQEIESTNQETFETFLASLIKIS